MAVTSRLVFVVTSAVFLSLTLGVKYSRWKTTIYFKFKGEGKKKLEQGAATGKCVLNVSISIIYSM